VVSSTPGQHFTSGKDPVPILQEAEWALGLVWTGGKSRPHLDLIPDRSASSQSLYQLDYQVQKYLYYYYHIIIALIELPYNILINHKGIVELLLKMSLQI